jgi:hypothetical protein
MANNYLITGHWGEPHVTPENDRGIHAGIFGAGRFVLPVGEQFRAEIVGNNTVRIYDGKLINNGAAAGIPVGKYVDLTFPNAAAGLYRNDLIVFQYALDSTTLIERGTFIVIRGAEGTGSGVDPAYQREDLLTGTAKLDQMPLWRVCVSEIGAYDIERMFTVADNLQTVKTALESEISSLETRMIALGQRESNLTDRVKSLEDNALSAEDVTAFIRAELGVIENGYY